MRQVKKAYENRTKHFTKHLKSVITIQSYARMWINRKRYVERKEYLFEHEDAVIKLQSYFRAMKARNDYNSLSNFNLFYSKPSILLIIK
jgi:hypothetical protein